MNKESQIIIVRSLNASISSKSFISRIEDYPDLSKNFILSRLDKASIKDQVREIIVSQGISSLFNYHITCDAIMHPGINVDEIEKIILEFVSTLKGIRNLYIIDPYFYSASEDVPNLFKELISELVLTLESITFFTQSRDIKNNISDKIHAIVNELNPLIVIKDVRTNEFHDRFWIDPDNKKGIVMGTSLNGVKKKIALIDYLKSNDVREIANIAMSLST